jgi:hypothetical protein
MRSKPFTLPCCGCQVVERDAGHGGSMTKSRSAAWRPQQGNPSGRVCLPPRQRHCSVVYRHTLSHSSLPCEQTAPGVIDLLRVSTP